MGQARSKVVPLASEELSVRGEVPEEHYKCLKVKIENLCKLTIDEISNLDGTVVLYSNFVFVGPQRLMRATPCKKLPYGILCRQETVPAYVFWLYAPTSIKCGSKYASSDLVLFFSISDRETLEETGLHFTVCTHRLKK
jgi:hypothetical protein